MHCFDHAMFTLGFKISILFLHATFWQLMHILKILFPFTFLLFLHFGLLIQRSILLWRTKLSNKQTFLTIVRLRCLRRDPHSNLFFFYLFSDSLCLTVDHTWSFFHFSLTFFPFFVKTICLVIKIMSEMFWTCFHLFLLTPFRFNFLLFSF